MKHSAFIHEDKLWEVSEVHVARVVTAGRSRDCTESQVVSHAISWLKDGKTYMNLLADQFCLTHPHWRKIENEVFTVINGADRLKDVARPQEYSHLVFFQRLL